MDKIYAATQGVYERQAVSFDKSRARDGREEKWLKQFIETIPQSGRILDLGCGTGEPIAAWLIARGYDVIGVDYSEPMLAIARKRFPNGTWLQQDMRDLHVPGTFDGIISWHGSFHLKQDEQRALLPKLARLLNPSGALMLTIGPSDGEATGTVGGETVYHASLDPSEYCALLATEGMSEAVVELSENDNGGAAVLLAKS